MKKHHNWYVCIAAFVIVVINYSFSDEIILNNGQNATTEILDTTGCSVKILRGGNKVTIKKNLIDKIIWKSDTISYGGYKCEESGNKAVRF